MKSIWQWFKTYWWKLGIVTLTLLLAYMWYLDAQIKPHFSGNKWQVPVQVYARPLTLSLKQEITQQEVIDELRLLGYRRQTTSQTIGEFSVGQQTLVVYRRAFHFPSGYAPAQKMRIQWANGRIATLEDLLKGDKLAQFRLEPWLVTRLLSGSQEDRMLLSFEDLPPYLEEALVLVEDRNFYEHHGVNPLAILRALIVNIKAGRNVQGGSTLTQQLVKNLYLTREQSYTRKIKEALMSLVIDARYSKDDILLAYFNEVFVGQNGARAVHGFGLGSHFYFDRPVSELNLPEVATLVGMLKGPSYYNPRRYPERAKQRRDVVLKVLFEQNAIDKAQYVEALNTPLSVASGASLASGKHPAYMDKIRRELSVILEDPDLRASGIKVFTALDINAQRRAEQALSKRLERTATSRNLDDLQGAMIVSDIATGGIRVIVGDRNTDNEGFNRALDISRSIGSLVKPAIYLQALAQPQYYTLASILQDQPVSIKDDKGMLWQPLNADEQFRGEVPLLRALTQSYNIPAVNLALDMGIPQLVDTLRLLGVQSTIPELPAISLGAINLSPLQVNQMYQVIANDGEYMPLFAVQAIVGVDNTLLWNRNVIAEQRFGHEAVYLLNYALHKVTKAGTAKALGKRFPKVNMAAKTGTTNDYRDSWMAAFDRNLVASIWVGADNNSQTGLSGSSGALPVYSDWQALMSPKSLSRRFPQGLAIAHFDPATGAQRQAGCQGSVSYPAIKSALSQQALNCEGKMTQKPTPKKPSWFQRIFGE